MKFWLKNHCRHRGMEGLGPNRIKQTEVNGTEQNRKAQPNCNKNEIKSKE